MGLTFFFISEEVRGPHRIAPPTPKLSEVVMGVNVKVSGGIYREYKSK